MPIKDRLKAIKNIDPEGLDWMQRVAMLLMSALVVLSFVAANLQALLWQYSDWLVGSILPAVVVDLTNEKRAAAALPGLNSNSLLDKAAQLKAEHMARLGYFSHYSPDGLSPWYWIESVGYTFAHAGENLAVHFNDSRALVQAWMDSPTHRDNIIAKQYTEIGIGTARGQFEGHDTVYVVQLFGTPAARPVPAPVLVTENDVLPADLTPTPVALGVVEQELVELPVVSTTEPFPLPTDNDDTIEPAVLSETVAVMPPERVVDTVGMVWQLPHLATSSGLKPLTLFTTEAINSGHTSPFVAVAVQPSQWLQGLYLLIGLMVALLLSVSLWVGYRQQRPAEIVQGVFLLVLMSALFALHVWLSSASAVLAAI
jgi:hypothetical protein